MRDEIKAQIRAILRSNWPEIGADFEFAVSRSPRAQWGEFSSNAAPRATQTLRALGIEVTPAQIGETLEREWNARKRKGQTCFRTEFRGGKTNFFMSDQFLHESLSRATREGAHYGAGDFLAGQRVLVEFVSSDPTGALSFSAGRFGAAGEAICRLFEAQGARVSREFYLNDATSSSKMQSLGESVMAWYRGAFGQKSALETTDNSAFVRGVASELARRDGAKWLAAPRDEFLAVASRAALLAAVESQKSSLARFGVRFDEWVSESQLRLDGRVENALTRLAQSGHTYESEGALWLKTTDFGDECDRVLRRSNGDTTYFAGDIAYHLWKFERGFDLILNIWSVEHRPYIGRTRAALRAAGIDEAKFEFLVCENAILKRDGVPLRLGSGGPALLFDEAVEEIGAGALKLFFLKTPLQNVAEVDLEIAARDEESNPAYAVQLLPSRLARLQRETEGSLAQNSLNGAAQNGESAPEWGAGERDLARLVGLWPDVSREAAKTRAPEKIAEFLLELATATREILRQSAPSAVPLPQRLELLRAAQSVAASALKILAIEAREQF